MNVLYAARQPQSHTACQAIALVYHPCRVPSAFVHRVAKCRDCCIRSMNRNACPNMPGHHIRLPQQPQIGPQTAVLKCMRAADLQNKNVMLSVQQMPMDLSAVFSLPLLAHAHRADGTKTTLQDAYKRGSVAYIKECCNPADPRTPPMQ